MTKGGPAARVAIEPSRVSSYACGGCGYGIVTARLPERCPMCSGRRWAPLVPARVSSLRGFGL